MYRTAGRTIAAVLMLAGGSCIEHTHAQGACGEVVTLKTHGKTTTAISIAMPSESAPAEGRMALVLLPGGPGYMALDAKGCARKLEGNSLVRSTNIFNAAGFATVLVDAPSDHRGEDGLGGFRLSAQHADDIGIVIAEIRERTKLPVWLIGTSRGAISAANAASRLNGPAAPDGLVLTSAVTSGKVGGRKTWVAQTALGAKLENIKIPVLARRTSASARRRTWQAALPPARTANANKRS